MGRKHTAADFRKRIKRVGECWVWTGPLSNDGRPSANYEGVREAAARVAWRLEVNPHLESNIQLRRTCKRPLCINPKHWRPSDKLRLEAVEWLRLNDLGWTHQQIAKKVGLDRSTVTHNLIRARRNQCG